MKRMLAAAAGLALVVTPMTGAMANAASPKIINGSQAQNPGWIARMNGHSGQYTYFCTSSLVASEWILIAKHCTQDEQGQQISDYDFWVGDNSDKGGTHVKGDKVETYSGGDLALIHLSSSGGSTFAPLADSDPSLNSKGTVYGWGATQSSDEGNHQSTTLKKAAITYVSKGKDGAQGPSLHASTDDGAVAGGDSGGPMVIGGKQVGVASTSDRSSSTDYSSVANGRDWIRQTTGS